jgi:hypothetical protein
MIFRFSGRLAAAAVSFALLALASPLATAADGPDVTVFTLSDTQNYGAAGGIRGYSVGTVSCNIGTAPLNWCDSPGGCGLGTTVVDHPVIAQNMYRLKDGRFEQLGASWLKHGFVSTNSPAAECGSCQAPPLGGNQLGVGCTDPYGAGLNGGRPLGRKSEVNPTTGAYPVPDGSGDQSTAWQQRLAVTQTDLSTTLHPGARYFVEGHYVAPDDALAGNGTNNASYREVSVNQSTFALTFVGSTVRRKAAIEGWQALDPAVELFYVDIPGSTPLQRFHVARKVTEPTPGNWHYEYAVHNMNADRATDRFSIEFFGDAGIANLGFRDVNAHSGEPYDITDWSGSSTASSVAWAAPAFPSSPANANAIRWGTMYSFWFDATRPPAEISRHVLRLFKKGTPAEVEFATNAEPVQFQDGYE